MKLVHGFAPVTGFTPLAQLERELNQFLRGAPNAVVETGDGPVATPPTDVREDDKQYVFVVELPGLRSEYVQVTLHEGVLSITGERRSETETTGVRYHRRERFVGRFARRFELGIPTAGDAIKASFRDGVLTVSVPKVEVARPKAVEITTE